MKNLSYTLAVVGLGLTLSPLHLFAGEPSGMLRGTVLDSASGLSTACTVKIVDSAGQTVIEHQSFQGGFRCDGRFTKSLPPGRTQLRVTRGFETRAEERVVDVPAGGSVDVEVRLERLVDLRRLGWYTGDSHAHMIHGEKTIPVDFDFVALTARAEDLQYLSIAQDWTLDEPTPERLAAEFAARSRTDCVLTWNLEAPKNYYLGDAGRCLGHCWSLGVGGHTRTGEDVIQGLLSASAHDYQSAKPSYANFESHELIHAQGGASFYSHPARWWTGSWGGQGGYPKQEKMRVSNMAVELPLDTLVGPTFDGLDIITGTGEFEANAMAFKLWALLLNHGYRLAGTASSDACFDRPGGAVPGGVRTYTHLEGDFSLAAVTRATARGRTFVSSGPLLVAAVDEQLPGSAFAADGRTHTLRIQTWASGIERQGLSRIEILRNGDVVHTHGLKDPAATFSTNAPISEKETAWYCVRAFGSDPARQRAISGAFFFEAPGFQTPAPVACQVRVTIQDGQSGERLAGKVTEMRYAGPWPMARASHVVDAGGSGLTIPGTVRLRAEVTGYAPQSLSPFFDHPALLEYITHLGAEDLLNWATFERVQSLLLDTRLSFRLRKLPR